MSSKAIPVLFIFIMCWNNFFSLGQRNPMALMLRSASHFMEVLVVGVNSGGCIRSGNKVRSGSSGIWRVTWQSIGNCVDTGWLEFRRVLFRSKWNRDCLWRHWKRNPKGILLLTLHHSHHSRFALGVPEHSNSQGIAAESTRSTKAKDGSQCVWI